MSRIGASAVLTTTDVVASTGAEVEVEIQENRARLAKEHIRGCAGKKRQARAGA